MQMWGRWVPLLLLLAPLVRAQDEEGPEEVEGRVQRITGPLRSWANSRPARDAPGRAAWQRSFDSQRTVAISKLNGLITTHGPEGAGRRLDITPACRALLSPLLMPRELDKTRELTRRLLAVDPKSAECWSILRGLLVTFEARVDYAGLSWAKVYAMARTLRGADGIEDEAALAVELLVAHIAYEMDDKRAARKAAESVLAGGAGADELRRDALRLRSRATRIPMGREAPAFRIAPYRGKRDIRLKDYRGRCVLLHFWHLGDDASVHGSIIGDCAETIAGADLVVLTIPVMEGDAPPKDFADLAQYYDWTLARPTLVGQDTARAYGVEGVSALFLIAPDGRVMKCEDWTIFGSAQNVAKLVRNAAGPPMAERIAGVVSWPTARALWRDLVARKRVIFDTQTWQAAEARGRYAYTALLLASAYANAPPERAIATTTLHGKLVAAWRSKDDAAWATAIKPLSKPMSDECAALVDAIFDLGLEGESVRKPLEQVAVRAKAWQTASMALRAIEFSDGEATPKRLGRLVRHKQWQVRLALAEALRAYRHRDAVDLLIKLLGDKRLRVRAKAADHLELLTGKSLGASQKRWTKWRRAQGAHLAVRPREISIYRPFRPPDRKYAHHSYHGLQIASNRIVFVLDKSESMYYGLFDGVLEEMEAHLSSVGPTSKFNVIEFDAKPRAWGKKLVPANEANVRGAMEYLNRAKPYGPTNIVESLRLSMTTPDLDSIVLLSDGLPNRGEPKTPGGILEAMRKENRYTRFAIHTVLLLEGRVFPHDQAKDKLPPLSAAEKARREAIRESALRTPLGAFLKQLADENDGSFGIGFADAWRPPPNAKFRPGTDK